MLLTALIEGSVTDLKLKQLLKQELIPVHEFIVVGKVTDLKLLQLAKAAFKFVILVEFEGTVNSNKLEHN